MAFLPTLDEVKAITKASDEIQALTEADLLWTLTIETVVNRVPESEFLTQTKSAQLYLAAHFLSMAFTDTGGRGPLSQSQIGDVSKAYTLPWLNRKDVYGGTQYGLMYLQIRNSAIIPMAISRPGRR